MKSWADHCSDSEDEDNHHPAAATATSPPAWHESSSEDEADQAAADEAPLPEPVPARTYTPADIPPGGPPFTAFVGNLPFSIKSPDDLVGEVRQLIGGDAGISRARLGKDRKTGKMGGFGYIEFDTADDLLALLNLPNQPPQIRGRDIKVDVAEQRQQPSGDRGDRGASFRGSGRGSRTNLSGNLDDIDGSKFRGGRGSMGRSGSGRNDGGNSNNNNNNRRNNNRQSSQKKDDGNSNSGPPPVRQSLKLAPRTKPAEGAERSSSSSIFGDAKPRDEAAWEKRSSLAKAAEDKKKDGGASGGNDGGDGEADGRKGGGDNKKDKDMRRSGSSTSVGKGGRGGGGAKRNNSTKSGGGKGGRGGGGGKGGRGGSIRKSDSQKSAGGGNDEKKKPEPTVPKSAIVAPPAEKKKDDKKVVNKFAALGFDSDSD